MKYKYAVVVGRFQPYHVVHHELVNHALSLADKVIVVLGSARRSPDVKNPFTPNFREEMIRSCFLTEAQDRLIFKKVRDYPYNENFWIAEIQNAVQSELDEYVTANSPSNGDELQDEMKHSTMLSQLKVALVGYMKDGSSYYLKLFPQFKYEEFYPNRNESRILNATDVRELYFNCDSNWKKFVAPSIQEMLERFAETKVFANLKQEFDYIQQYRKDSKFIGLSYEPTFLTTDAVVTAMGHVLVVRRGHQPGRGKLALPGGFLHGRLRLEDNVLKELKEETKIHVPDSVLRGSIKGERKFDDPDRSQRGRTVTHAFHIELQASLEKGLPTVKGGDDADKALWLPISSIGELEEEFFEDHVHIIRHFLGLTY